MKLKDQGEWIILNVVAEETKDKLVDVKIGGKVLKDQEGNKIQKTVEVVVKEVLLPTGFLKSGITMVGSALSDRFRPYKSKSTIFDTYSQKHYVVKHTPEEIREGLINKPIGFRVGQTKK